MIEAAAGVDPEIAALWQKLQDQRRYGMGLAAADILAAAGATARGRRPRPGLTAEQAGDIMWFLTGPWAFRALVTERGWSPRRVRGVDGPDDRRPAADLTRGSVLEQAAQAPVGDQQADQPEHEQVHGGDASSPGRPGRA